MSFYSGFQPITYLSKARKIKNLQSMKSSPYWLVRELYDLCASRKLCYIAKSLNVIPAEVGRKNFMKTVFMDSLHGV